MSQASGDLVELHLIGLPLDIWARSQEHMDGLLREFALLAAGEANNPNSHVPRRLLELMKELQANYQGVTSEQDAQIEEAWEAGQTTIDLTYRLPPDVADASVRLDAALDEADNYCRTGEYLLSLATPPEPLAFRRWALGQFIDQIAGRPAQSWQEWRAAHPS